MVVDETALLDAMGGDWETVRSIVKTFLRALDAYQAELETCLASQDAGAVREVAHKLKGALANLRAETARAHAATLEVAAHEGRTADFPQLVSLLSSTMAEARTYFQSERFKEG